MANIIRQLFSPLSTLFAPVTVYSFLDLTGIISHPSIGAYTLTGQGVGEITIAMATDSTNHDIGVDGAVVPTQIPGNNGTITISIQQTSPLNKWLVKWANHIKNESTPRNEWLMATAILRGRTMGIEHQITGISPQKIPDRAYQAQGQRVSWVLMAADIQTF